MQRAAYLRSLSRAEIILHFSASLYFSELRSASTCRSGDVLPTLALTAGSPEPQGPRPTAARASRRAAARCPPPGAGRRAARPLPASSRRWALAHGADTGGRPRSRKPQHTHQPPCCGSRGERAGAGLVPLALGSAGSW